MGYIIFQSIKYFMILQDYIIYESTRVESKKYN